MSPAGIRRTALLLALSLPWLPGCGGGCGEAPQTEKTSTTTGGGTMHGGGGSGGDASFGPKTQAALERPLGGTRPQAPAAPEKKPLPPPVSAAPVFEEVTRVQYETKVLKSLSGALVVSYTPLCSRWQEVQGALKGVSEDFKGKVAVYRLDVTDPEQAKALPPGMPALPVPSFAYYESGQAVAQRQGLPFDYRRGKGGEPIDNPADYQQRLRTWLGGAIEARNFLLPEPK